MMLDTFRIHLRYTLGNAERTQERYDCLVPTLTNFSKALAFFRQENCAVRLRVNKTRFLQT